MCVVLGVARTQLAQGSERLGPGPVVPVPFVRWARPMPRLRLSSAASPFSFQIASSLSKELCALVFGVNTFFATVLKTIVILIVADKRCLGLPVRSQVSPFQPRVLGTEASGGVFGQQHLPLQRVWVRGSAAGAVWAGWAGAEQEQGGKGQLWLGCPVPGAQAGAGQAPWSGQRTASPA